MKLEVYSSQSDGVSVKNKVSKAVKEFSRFANEYNNYNIIQAEVAKTLVEQLPSRKYSTIIDVGAGSGEVYKNIEKENISFEQFIALDSSQEMLDIHPSHQNIKKIYADFNIDKTFEKFTTNSNSVVLSSSALQWSRDLDFTLSMLSKKSPESHFAMFTAATFKTLHQVAGVKSPIYSEDKLKEIINKYYNSSAPQLRKYSLYFDSVREMFRYIKRSGVNGGEKNLSYKQMKHIMKVYPLNYLEFEVLFIKVDSLCFRNP